MQTVAKENVNVQNASSGANRIQNELTSQRELIEKIWLSVEKTRKYYLWTMILTLAFFIIPLIIMAIVLPSFISEYSSMLNGSALGL